jgi:hypothetical protein
MRWSGDQGFGLNSPVSRDAGVRNGRLTDKSYIVVPRLTTGDDMNRLTSLSTIGASNSEDLGCVDGFTFNCRAARPGRMANAAYAGNVGERAAPYRASRHDPISNFSRASSRPIASPDSPVTRLLYVAGRFSYCLQVQFLL